MAATFSPGGHETARHAPCDVSAALRLCHQKRVGKACELSREAQAAGAYLDDLLSFEMSGKPSAEFERL